MGNIRKSIVKKLPSTHQTSPNKRFFSATFDQLLSERNSEVINGYIGRRVGGQYQPKNDYYVSQPFRVRNNYALEPIAVSKNPDTLDNSNEFFYEDIVNYIKYYGGDVSNHDRLFSSEYYSWAPPIDIDKFLNYQNYYWINEDWPIISMPNLTDADITNDIIGKESYEYEVVGGDNFELQNGFIVEFPDATHYNEAYYVTGVGCESGISLLKWNDDTTFSVFPNQGWENIPWDDSSTTWDSDPWDSIRPTIDNDYITIARGSCDNNAWSRTNFWFHIETIRKMFEITGTVLSDSNISRANRPIIEFKSCLELYEHGKKFIGSVDLSSDGSYSDLINTPANSAEVDQTLLRDGNTLIFLDPDEPFRLSEKWDSVVWDCGPWDHSVDYSDDYNTAIWSVTIEDNTLFLSLDKMAYEGDSVLVKGGVDRFGRTYYVKNNRWKEAGSDKTSENQAPLFALYDCEGVALDDSTKYPNSTFDGSKIFGYSINEFSPIVDSVLGIPLSYRSSSGVSEIEFENFLETERYRYFINNESMRIGGHYFYNCMKKKDYIIDDEPTSIIYNENSTNLSVGSFVVSQVGHTLVTTDNSNLYFYMKEKGEWELEQTITFDGNLQLNNYPTEDTKHPVAISPDNTYVAVATIDGSDRYVSIYQRMGDTWNHHSDIQAPDATNDHSHYGKNIVLTYDDDQLTAIVGNYSDTAQNLYVYRYDCENDWSLVQTLTDGGFDISYDVSSIYTPDVDSGNVYEYTLSGTSYSLSNTHSITNVTDVDHDIDQDIYVMANTGRIITTIVGGNTIEIDLSSLSDSILDLSLHEDRLAIAASNGGDRIVFVYDFNVISNEWELIHEYTSDPDSGDSVYINHKELFVSNPTYVDEHENVTGIIHGFNIYDPCDLDDGFMNSWLPVDEESRQRVIDRYVVESVDTKTYELSIQPQYNNNIFDVEAQLNGKHLVYGQDFTVTNDRVMLLVSLDTNDVLEFYSYGTIDCYNTFSVTSDKKQYMLSKIPQYDEDVLVYVNGVLVVSSEWKIKHRTLTFNKNFTLNDGDTIEVEYQSSDNLVEQARGYYEIPATLEKNPAHEEVTSHTFNDFSQHFLSIINNQPTQKLRVNFSDDNTYRNSCKDNSVGSYIWQHRSSLLKSMLVASDEKLNVIESIRMSQREYARYKNKFLSIAHGMIKRHELTGDIERDFNETILRLVNTLETKGTFHHTYMFAYGSDVRSTPLPKQKVIWINRPNKFTDNKNSLYFYVDDNSGNRIPLYRNIDYNLQFNESKSMSDMYLIRIELSDEILNLLNTGSYSDITMREYVDTPRTYMPSTPSKLGLWEVCVPQIIQDNTYEETPLDQSQSTSFILGHDGSRTPLYGDERDDLLLELETRIYNNINDDILTRSPSLTIQETKPGKFRNTNWLKEEFESVIQSNFYKWCNYYNVDWQQNSYYDEADEWTFNYRNYGENEQNVSGYWRGIYDYYYDTETPHTTPWEMLGFSCQPLWWEDEYGVDYSSNNTTMWEDIESGNIRHGNRKGVDSKYIREGLVSTYIPVDSNGDLKSPQTIGLVTEPQLDSEKSRDFKFGDGGPVESLWKASSDFRFHMIEALYLTQPAKFAELFWNPSFEEALDINPNHYKDRGYCRKKKLHEHYVHAEQVDGETVYRTGYQHWVSDRLTLLNQNITNTFGEKVRQLNVKLANKVGGFTNHDRFKAYFNSTNLQSTTTSGLVPNENVDIKLYTSPTIKTYDYSGVVVRAMADGTYKVYGYNILEPEFKMHPRSEDTNEQQITVGGKSANFRIFEFGQTYTRNEIVKYNNTYYKALADHTANRFDTSRWQRLPELPRIGGISVVYKPIPNREKTISVPYGTTLEDTQEVFDFLIAYGDWLETQGWKFENFDREATTISNWKQSGKEFLFWVTQNWAPDEVIKLSPLASKTKLEVSRGYPSNVEKESNGIYSILNSDGIVVDPRLTAVERDQRTIEVVPKFQENNIYFNRVKTEETEHVVIFDNTTSFNDILYSPLFATRQSRLRVRMIRTKDWIGKYEAGGYIFDHNNDIKPNMENTTNSMRLFHDRNDYVDDKDIQDTARHLTGFDEKGYLDDLQLDEDVQFLFYSGMIREKGTQQSIKKLLRSIYVQQDQDINVLDEWAIKLSDYGGTSQNISIDFKLKPQDIKVDPQIITLDTPQSDGSFVSEIKILTNQTIWNNEPNVIINTNPTDPNNANIDPASAKAVLDDDGILIGLTMVDHGAGYTLPPTILLEDSVSGNQSNDILYPVLTKHITDDDPTDDIIHIDVDDDDRWVIKPRELTTRDLWPTTNNIDYGIPNAGYVLEGETEYSVFNQSDLYDTITDSTPSDGDYIWVAKDYNTEWMVYRTTSFDVTYILEYDEDSESVFLRSTDELPISALPNGFNQNVAILSDIEFSDGSTRTIDTTVVSYNGNTGSAYPHEYEIAIDNPSEIEYGVENESIACLMKMRFKDKNARQDFFVALTADYALCLNEGDLTYVDHGQNDKWVVQEIDNASLCNVDDNEWHDVRRQEPLLDTDKFMNAYLYDFETSRTIAHLPVLDPFKGIIAGPAKQNLDYITKNDPARYTNSDDERLVNRDQLFTDKDLGKLWWDISQTRVLYYEQSDIRYRRNNWGRFFDGSEIAVYEWTESLSPPSEYTGQGTPKSESDYVAMTSYDSRKNRDITKFYFWVRGISSRKSNRKNRTLSAMGVENLIRNPKSQKYRWFAPINTHKDDARSDINEIEKLNSVVIANYSDIVSSRECGLQINYRYNKEKQPNHAEWCLIRDNDNKDIILKSTWKKLVDSLVGLTEPINIEDNIGGKIPAGSGLHYLMVPDPTLSEEEKYGIENRPRQSWFMDIHSARKVATQKINEIMSDIPLRELYPGQNEPSVFSLIGSSSLWEFEDWFAKGFSEEDISVTTRVNSLSSVNKTNLSDGDIILVVNSRLSVNSSNVSTFSDTYYQYDEDSDTFVLVCKTNHRFKLRNKVYTDSLTIGELNELRSILNVLITEVLPLISYKKLNHFFVSMLHYVLSEQNHVDWAFKTTYTILSQVGVTPEQEPLLQNNPIPSLIDYINSVKPYHTKIRDFTNNIIFSDEATIDAEDEVTKRIKMKFARVSCSGWDSMPWDSVAWDNERCDEGEILDSGQFVDDDEGDDIVSSSDYDENESETFAVEPDETLIFDENSSSYLLGMDVTNGAVYVQVNGEEFFNHQIIEDVVTKKHDDMVSANTYNTNLPLDIGGDLDNITVELIDTNDNVIPQTSGTDYTAHIGTGGEALVEFNTVVPVGYSVRFTYTFITFYSLSNGDVVDIYDHAPLNSGQFNSTETSPTEELIILKSRDNISVYVHEQNAQCDIGFTLYQSMAGVFEYWRSVEQEAAVMVGSLSKDGDSIEITQEGGVGLDVMVSLNNPGRIKIGNEIILYHERNGNILSNLVRGHDNTSIQNHDAGEVIRRIDESVNVPQPEDYYWEDDQDATLFYSDTPQSNFITEYC